jgi:hypothetical protein
MSESRKTDSSIPAEIQRRRATVDAAARKHAAGWNQSATPATQ